jgi:hypothetical protein
LYPPSYRSTSDFYGVRYCYIPIGNKTIALHYIIRNYVTTPLVMIIDDDVMIPRNADMEGAFNNLNDNDKMKAVAFTIRGIDRPNISYAWFVSCFLSLFVSFLFASFRFFFFRFFLLLLFSSLFHNK